MFLCLRRVRCNSRFRGGSSKSSEISANSYASLDEHRYDPVRSCLSRSHVDGKERIERIAFPLTMARSISAQLAVLLFSWIWDGIVSQADPIF